ncbi:NAD+ synthetase [Mesomycoplasma conjunctivae]|nr:NAD+ synthetase [Mesomycoplasma conjunctivae]
MKKEEKYIEYLISWIKKQVEKANKKGVIFGLSGGIDSALVGVLGQKAFPYNHLGVIMPIRDMEADKQDIEKLANKFNIKTIVVDLLPTFTSIKNTLNLNSRLSIANIQPKLRMTTLYALAQEYNYLVLGTDNLVEMYIGYFTKYGDGGVDLLPIVNLTKTQVYKVAKHIGVVDEILTKAPSAGLWENQKDEDEMGFSYKDFDIFLKNPEKLSAKKRQRIEYLHKISEHKRSRIPQPKLKMED